MSDSIITPDRQQESVNAYFQSRSSFWKDIYSSEGVFAEIHRDRHVAVLEWIDDLTLASGCRVLEVGCGAGFMSIALAQRGLRVHGIDTVESMIGQARQHAAEAGVVNLLSLDIDDVYDLAFEDESFDLVIALGVIPWLERPERAIQEMARVTKPGGHVILTADNRARLNLLLDPLLNPTLTPLKQDIKRALERIGLRRRSSEKTEPIFHAFHDRRFIDTTIASAELLKVRSMTLGFGPFSLFRHKVLTEPFATALHHRLQRLADRGVPAFRSTGAHYIILAGKKTPRHIPH
jgi:ubiquinone/menaquinone biosynthesis C-methylase UbiE